MFLLRIPCECKIEEIVGLAKKLAALGNTGKINYTPATIIHRSKNY